MTNAFIVHWSGSELYLRDLAAALAKRGHTPILFSPRLGKLAAEIRATSIPVTDDLATLGGVPDLIHGQHHLATMTALARFPDTPAIFFCHGWLPWEETPPAHPRIVHYVAVSEAVRDRLLFEHGVPEEKISTILNFVDLDRFQPRPPLPASPKRALIFCNGASETNYARVVREACARHGVAVDIVGLVNGNPSFAPEGLLGEYDLVFARGRAALEGLAVGAAVVCCGPEGLGPIVASHSLERLRNNNLGIRVLSQPITVDGVSAEIAKYDSADAEAVSRTVRANAGMGPSVDRIVALYRAALAGTGPDGAAEGRAVSVYLRWLSESWPPPSVAEPPAAPTAALALTAGAGDDTTTIQPSEAVHHDAPKVPPADLPERAPDPEPAVAPDSDSLPHAEALAERDEAREQLQRLRSELDRIHGSLTWRLYERAHRSRWIHGVYLFVAAPLSRSRARHRRRLQMPANPCAEEPKAGEAPAIIPPVHGQTGAQEAPALACVVISLANQPTLVDAVRSMLAQSVPTEIVVVNSGGGDPAATLRSAGLPVKVLNHGPCLRPGAARNLGILATRAPYVAFLAADCVAEPGWVEERLHWHLAGARAVSSAVTNRTPRNLWSWGSYVSLFARRMPGSRATSVLHYGVSYARELFDQFGLFRPELAAGEDSDFNDRLAGSTEIRWAPGVRSAHLHPDSLIGLLRDQYARGGRMVAVLAALTGRSRRALVTSNAFTRIPGLMWQAWRSTGFAERLFVAGSAPLMLPAATAYALGAMLADEAPRTAEAATRKPRILALLTFRNESGYLPDYLENVAPQVDGIVALDDGSTDESADLVGGHPAVLELLRKPPRQPHVWDEPGNRRLLVNAALRHEADWFVVVDADERLERGFRERAEMEIVRASAEGLHAYCVKLLELWDYPDRYRADGLWGQKRPVRFFRARRDHEFDDRAFHGHWAPLNSRQDGSYPPADLVIYHLRMIHPDDRAQRQAKYHQLDPDRRFQPIGYDYLTDTRGLRLEPCHPQRIYEPLARTENGGRGEPTVARPSGIGGLGRS